MIYISILFVTCIFIGVIENMLSIYSFSYKNLNFRITPKDISFLFTFIFLSFFSAIRDNCGIDYGSYMFHISNIQKGMGNYMEFGFQKMVLIMKNIDTNPRLVIIVIGVLTCFFYLKSIWDQSDDRFLSIFIFIAWGYYFLTFNTIRNYFALSLVLYSIKYLRQGNKVIFILIVLLASLFHKTVLICVPLYFLANIEFKLSHYLGLGIITISLLVFKNLVRGVVFLVYPEYLNSVYDNGGFSTLNILKAIFAICIYLYCYRRIKDDRLARFYFNLNVFSLVFYIGMYWLPEISRIGFYMNASTIMLIPKLLNCFSHENSKRVKFIFICFSLVLFLLLLQSFQSPIIKLLPYDNWLFNDTYNLY